MVRDVDPLILVARFTYADTFCGRTVKDSSLRDVRLTLIFPVNTMDPVVPQLVQSISNE